MLNEKQIKQFKEDGFVLVPELFNKSEITEILEYTEKLQTKPEVSGEEWKYFEESKLEMLLITARKIPFASTPG